MERTFDIRCCCHSNWSQLYFTSQIRKQVERKAAAAEVYLHLTVPVCMCLSPFFFRPVFLYLTACVYESLSDCFL